MNNLKFEILLFLSDCMIFLTRAFNNAAKRFLAVAKHCNQKAHEILNATDDNVGRT